MPGHVGERGVIGEGGDKELEVKEGVERKDCHMFGMLLSSMVKSDKLTNRLSKT